MEQERLAYLFECYHKNSCTKEELEELNQWYDQLHEGDEQIEEWIAHEGGREQLVDQLYQNFSLKVSSRNRFRTLMRWGSAAAVLFVVLGAALFYSRFSGKEMSVDQQLAQSVIRPGTNKAYLTLSDGRRIDLDNSPEGEIYRDAGISILKTDSGSLVYHSSTAFRKVADAQMKFHTLHIPRGGQYKVTLTDGTKVWMNSASALRFPVTSNGSDRLVFLSGEGYFEVAHNKQLPFKVRTADQQVQVLGTHFNVRGFAGESTVATTLLEGSVKISKLSSGNSKLLKPGQQANTSRLSKDIPVISVNTDQAIAWKNGYFIFDNEDIQSIMKAISRWYDVDISYAGKLSNERYGGTFSRNANLREILDNLQELGNVRFSIHQRTVIVTVNTQQ